MEEDNTQDTNKSRDTPCQCHKCKQIFHKSQLSSDVQKRHLSPCCNSSYTVLSKSLDIFFEKYLYINTDLKYFNY